MTSSSARVGGLAPGRETVMAAIAMAWAITRRRASSLMLCSASRFSAPSRPSVHSPSMMPPMKESPAPTVSATIAGWEGTSRRRPEEVTARAPSGPRVTTAMAGPSSSQERRVSSWSAPLVSHSRSSSEHLTTSEAAIRRSTSGRASPGVPISWGRTLGS